MRSGTSDVRSVYPKERQNICEVLMRTEDKNVNDKGGGILLVSDVSVYRTRNCRRSKNKFYQRDREDRF